MRKVSLKTLKKENVMSDLFTGAVSIQSTFEVADISVAFVNFPKGIHNKFHKHSTDQILIVTEGKGFVATQKRKIEVEKGDIIWTPAGEVHKHGALEGFTFSHISITKSNSRLKQVEK